MCFLTVLEAGESNIKAPADSVPGESQFPGHRCPHTMKGAGEFFGFLLLEC